MSDPKDKLVLFKEILSLMIVTIGFITALMSSGIVKNIKIEPVTLIIIIAVALFIVQLLVRMVFGEEQYVEIKKKVIATLRDFSIVMLIIIGFYFAGKYAANYNPSAQPPEQPPIQTADVSKEAEKSLSAAPLKNLKKEKASSAKSKDKDKEKDKAAAKKSDDKHSGDDEKSAKTAQKASVKHEDEKNLKTAKNEDKKDDKTSEVSAVKEAAPVQSAETAAVKETEPVQITETPVLKEAKPEKTAETSIAKEIKTEHTAEASITKTPAAPPAVKEAQPAATAETAIAAGGKKPEPVKPAETVVIDVIAEDTAPAPAAPAVKNEAAPAAAKASDEVQTYKLTKDPDEENDEDISAAGTSVKFEQTSDELREKVNNDKVIIKKEYEINKTPSGLKNAGEKVMEGGKKIFDGGANLLEKAGHGIKKQINKVIK